MRTKQFIFFPLVFLLLLASCHSDKKQEVTQSVTTIRVDNIDDAEDIEVTKDKYIKSFRYIQLETDTTALIGEMTKILYEDNRIYIMDQSVTKSLFIFDKEGNFINKIYRYGQGPEEYYELTDAFYDPKENTINILSFVGRNKYKIMVFDADGKTLLKQLPINLNLAEAMKSKDGFLVCNSKHTLNASSSVNRLTVYTDNLKKLYDAVPILPQWRNGIRSASPELFKSQNGAIFCAPHHETDVYQVTRDSTFLKYRFDFGKYNFPEEFNTPVKNENMVRNSQISNYVTELSSFCETDDYVVATFLFKGQYRIAFYDKATKKTEVFFLSSNPLLYDIFGDFAGMSKNVLIATRPATGFLRLFNDPSIMGEDETEEIKRQFKKPLLEDDNPIICVYELR